MKIKLRYCVLTDKFVAATDEGHVGTLYQPAQPFTVLRRPRHHAAVARLKARLARWQTAGIFNLARDGNMSRVRDNGGAKGAW